MTEYELRCECGKRVWVPSTDAGRTVSCKCGKVIEIPSLYGLRALVNEPPPEPRDERPLSGKSREVWAGVAVVIVGVIFAAVLRSQTGRISRGNSEGAIIALLVQVVTGVVGCSIFAKSKGIQAWIGGLLGIFSCLGLIVLFFLPVREIREPRRGRKS